MRKFVGQTHNLYACDRNKRKRIIDKCVAQLKPKSNQFSAIAVTGYSATIFGAPVAYLLNKNIVVVRKPGVESQSCSPVQGLGNTRCVFIDDLVASGDTLARVVEGVESIGGRVVGLWLAHSDKFDVKDGGVECFPTELIDGVWCSESRKVPLWSSKAIMPFC